MDERWWRLDLSDDDERRERRYGIAEIIAQIATLRQQCAEIPLIRQRVHDMANTLGILTDRAERAEDQHKEMMDELRAGRAEAAMAMAKHDERDDDRFDQIGSRLSLMDQLNAANEARRQADGQHESHRMMLLCAVIGVVGAIVATVIPMLAVHAGVHP